MKDYHKMSILSLLAAVVILLSACGNLMFNRESRGSLAISIADKVTRSFLPEISMTPTEYSISGIGPDGATFNVSIMAGATANIDNLAFGDWTIAADAKNAVGAPIGTGMASTTVHSNETAAVQIEVKPYRENGALDLTVRWTATDIDSPQIKATLRPTLGNDRDLLFSLGEGIATYSATDIPAGYYSLSLLLKDNEVTAMGAVEIVRIVSNQTTSGQFVFDKVNQVNGAISINLAPAMSDPLSVSITGATPAKEEGTSLQLGIDVGDYIGNTTCVWYVNGQLADTANDFAFGPEHKAGNYRVDATVFSADGSRAGSATANIEVILSSLVWTTPTDGGITEDTTPLLDWNDIAGAMGYELQFAATEETVSSAAVHELNASEYQYPTELSAGDAVYWRVRTKLSDGSWTSWSPILSFTIQTAYAIRDIGPAGGFIFYDKGNYDNGWRYLEAAQSDYANAVVWRPGYEVINCQTNAGIGTGDENTLSIVSHFGSGEYAARVCADYTANGFDDWFLPSKDELAQMYAELRAKSVGALKYDSYWSSSEYTPSYAWFQNFADGSQSAGMGFNFWVRPIRRF